MIIVAFALCSCVAMDVLSMDTAEIKPTQKPTISTYTSFGLNVSELVLNAMEQEENDPHEDLSPPLAIMQVLSLSVPANDKRELGVRFWLGGVSAGGKFYGKYQVHSSDTNTIAIIPAAVFLISSPSSFDYAAEDNIRGYSSAGLELQALNTLRPGALFQPTFALRANYHYYRENGGNHLQSKWNSYHVFHGGARLNLKRRFGGFFIMLESGVEFVPTAHNWDMLMPVFGLGCGIQ